MNRSIEELQEIWDLHMDEYASGLDNVLSEYDDSDEEESDEEESEE